jgi:hypothetical protein
MVYDNPDSLMVVTGTGALLPSTPEAEGKASVPLCEDCGRAFLAWLQARGGHRREEDTPHA